MSIPAITITAPRAEPSFAIILPTLLLLAIPLFLPSTFGILKLAVAIPLTVLLILVGSQLPSTITVLGVVLAEIAIERSTRMIAWSTGVTILIVGLASLTSGDSDSLRPLWLVHGIGIGIFVALGVAIRERRALVAETKRSLEMAETTHKVQLAEAIANERLEISRELHNRLGHQLTVISLHSEVAKQSKRQNPQVRASLDAIGESARQSLSEISLYLDSLRDKTEPAAKDELLRIKFDRFRDLGLAVNSNVESLPNSLSREQVAFADSALDELLINALKYGDGSVTYQQEFAQGWFTLTLTNGVGNAKKAPSAGGFGLKDISDRATQVGALFAHEILNTGRFQASLSMKDRS